MVTILNMRAPGMTLLKMPMFSWTWLITACLLIAVMPVVAGAITMTLTDRHFGTTFFGHPAVYIMILTAFGIVSQVVPAFSCKRLFGHVGLRHQLDRDPVVHRRGAPHVHHRPAGDGSPEIA